MLLERSFEPPDLVVAAVGGVVTQRDQALLVEWVRSAIGLVGSVKVLVHLHQFAGWRASEGVDDDTWWLRDDEGISAIAIVGPRECSTGILTVIAQPLRQIPIRYFEAEAAARAWLHIAAAPITGEHRTAN